MRIHPLTALLAAAALTAASAASLAQQPTPPSSTTDPSQPASSTSSTSSSTSDQSTSPQSGSDTTQEPTTSGTTDTNGSTAQSSRGSTDEDDQDDARSQTTRQAAAGQRGTATLPVVMMLVPIAIQDNPDTAMRNGCWVKMFGQQSYKGDSLTLLGPVDMSNMTGPFGIEWDDKISSIKTGPRTNVVIYDNINYRDRAAKIGPEQEVPELSEKLGFFEEVKSMKVNCPRTATG